LPISTYFLVIELIPSLNIEMVNLSGTATKKINKHRPYYNNNNILLEPNLGL